MKTFLEKELFLSKSNYSLPTMPSKAIYHTVRSFDDPEVNQSVENAGVAFVKGANERNELFEKI